MRYALYFTPSPDDLLTKAATRWIGRDAFGDAPPPPLVVDGLQADEIARHTASARKYGFHATLKAPFELAEGKDEAALVAAANQFCKSVVPFVMSPLKISRIGKFFALVPEEERPRLSDFAAMVVRDFEPFRAPLSDADIARRNPEMLSDLERGNLYRWGYPYVFDAFRFHMTLTGPIEEPDVAPVNMALHAWFDPILGIPVNVSALTIFIQPEPDAPFRVHSQIPLGAPAERKTD